LASLYGAKWMFTHGDIAISRQGERQHIRILHRHHFSFSLSHMSTIVSLDMDDTSQLLALVKGAPEVIVSRLNWVPKFYHETFLHFASQGKRVIAMGYKILPKPSRDQIRNISRNDIESDLEFCGFLIFECPLKSDTKDAVQMLVNSSHKVVIITGDNPLTACEVAREIGVTSKPILVLEKVSEDQFNWIDLESSVADKLDKNSNKSQQSFPLTDYSKIDKFDFCIYGEGLSNVLNHRQCAKILSRTRVIARASPENKTTVITILKSNGYTTLMCGDGTNDVGALKQAHVGIALLNNIIPPPEGEKEPKKEKEKNNIPLEDTGPKGTRAKRARVRHSEKPEQKIVKISKSKLEKLKKEKLAKMEEKEREAADPRLIQLGDASIASPFTAKSSSVLSVAHIIRQGRCTLVATRQMFSILALNCLVHAYSLSVLYIDGIKLGDMQSTITGFLIATCFLSITSTKPLEQLSSKKPTTSLFSLYLFASIIGQFAIHITSLIYVVNEAYNYQKGEKPKPDSTFSPSLVNSAVFLIMTTMQVSTFATNYVGHPYMESLRDNKVLSRCLVGCLVVAFVAATELVPPFNEFFELVRFPAAFKAKLLMVMIGDFVGAFVVERLSRKVLASSSL